MGNRRKPLSPGLPSAPRSSLAELLIAEHYGNDFCLIQEKNHTLIALTVGSTHCWSQPLSSWPPQDGDPGLSRLSRRQRFKHGRHGAARRQSSARHKAFALAALTNNSTPNTWIAWTTPDHSPGAAMTPSFGAARPSPIPVSQAQQLTL